MMTMMEGFGPETDPPMKTTPSDNYFHLNETPIETLEIIVLFAIMTNV